MKKMLIVILAIGILLAVIVYVSYQLGDNENRTESFDQNYQALELSSPQPNATVSHAFTISGEANQYWFYSGSMPIQIIDPFGHTLWQANATPTPSDDTTGPVSFTTNADVGSYRGQAYILFIQAQTGEGQEFSTTTVPITVQ